MQEAPLFSFDSPKGQSSYIKVIGVGGGGGNAVNHMFREGISGVDFIVCNTDMKALGASPVPNKIPLGSLGLGAGGKPEKARKAALDKADDIREALSHNTQMLFITAGMGGGTGTGAAPVIAEIAKSIKLESEENEEILVVAIVTRPFSFEGRQRMEQAAAGIKALREKVDSIIIIDNDKLFEFGDLTMSQAYAMADDVLLTAAKGIAEIISKEGYICRDFQDINSVMEHSGKALMGTGSGSGENRAQEAIDAATKSVLLDDSDIHGAKNVLLYFTSSHEHEMTIREQMQITDYVCKATGGFADVKYGAGYDDELGDELKVTLIATGFDKAEKVEPEQARRDFIKPDTPSQPVQKTDPVQKTKPQVPGEPHLVSRKPSPTEPVDTTPKPAVNEETKVRVHKLDEDEPKKDVKDEKCDPKAVDELVDGIKLVKKEPEAQQTATPVKQTTSTPVNQTTETPVNQTTETPVNQTTSNTVNQTPGNMVDQQPAATETLSKAAKTTVADLIHDAFRRDSNMANSADRIRMIHDLLRNDPAGPDTVANMNTRQIAASEGVLLDDIVLPHSSQREASGYTVLPGGKVVEKPTLHDNAD